MNTNNHVKASGIIRSAFTYDHKENGRSISKTELDIIRKHHRYPHTVTIMLPSEMIEASEDYTNQMVMVTGGLQSFDTAGEESHDQGIYIMAETITIIASQEKCVNEVCLKGVLCRRPLTKMVSHDSLVSVFLLAVEDHERIVYVPCSVGDWAAMDVAAMEVGTRLEVSGWLHSRKSKISVWVNQNRECLRRI